MCTIFASYAARESVVVAVQVTVANLEEVCQWVDGSMYLNEEFPERSHIKYYSNWGLETAAVGDFVIRTWGVVDFSIKTFGKVFHTIPEKEFKASYVQLGSPSLEDGLKKIGE